MSVFQLKDKLDNFLFACFNVFSDFYFIFRFRINKLVKLNVKYKDIHKGSRCFIIGTGPSLNQLTKSQLAKLKNEIIFGVNSYYKIEILKEIIPKYYSLFDNLYWEEEKDFFKSILQKYIKETPIFLTDYRAWFLLNKLGICDKSMFLFAKKYPINEINNDPTKNMHIGMNVVCSTILIAIYMGFKEIFLLGCDYNSFATIIPEHSYNDEDEKKYNTENLAFYLKFYAITTKFHYLIADLAMKKGIKIINITNGSLLDAYPREDPSIVL